jgi:Zn-dependent protease with chaperone function
MVQAWLYDGRSAVRRAARVEPGPDGLRLIAGSGEEVFVATSQLVHAESRRGHEVYGHSDLPGWRLGLPSPLAPELAPVLPRRQTYGRWIDRIGLGPALLTGAVLSAMVIFIGTRTPDLVAPHVPRSWEAKYADALMGDLDGRVCDGQGGQAALDLLAAKLSPRPGELRIRVADLKMVNAVALPGGTIVLFDGLLRQADSPDEVAGVLAHEIAHVENRDVTRALIRQYGLGLLLVGFGGTTGGNLETLLAADYSRDAEGQADGDAITALQRAQISPVPTARFFDRLTKLESGLGRFGEVLTYVSSHPQSTSRRERFLRSAQPGRRYRPALDTAEWNALKGICHRAGGSGSDIVVKGRR